MTNQQEHSDPGREIVINRVLNAPKELVWKVWTEPEHIARWWGPDGFTNTIHEMNVTVGGTWRFMMHGPNGMNFPKKIVFEEVTEPARLVYSHCSEDPNHPSLFQTVVTFDDQDGKTRLTMRTIFANAAERDRVAREYRAVEGAKQTINRLEDHLSEMQPDELVITRVFNAPRELVYKAFSEPEALAKWWGPKGSVITVSAFAFKPNGNFHYCMEMHGQSMWGLFRYLEMTEPERIVYVNSFSDAEGNVTANPFLPAFPLEILNIVTLEDMNGKTAFKLRGGPIHANEAAIKTFNDMKAGINQGFAGTFEQLEAYLAGIDQ